MTQDDLVRNNPALKKFCQPKDNIVYSYKAITYEEMCKHCKRHTCEQCVHRRDWRYLLDHSYDKGWIEGFEVAKEKYNKMYDQAEYDLAYKRGLEAGEEMGKAICKVADNVQREAEDRAYQKGLDDAWKLLEDLSVRDFYARREIFGNNKVAMDEIIKSYSVSEVKAKIEAWEKAQKKKDEKKDDEIKVGDEVIFENESRAVVAHVDLAAKTFDIIFANGETSYVSQDDVTKTGRHFDVDKILEEMREKE